MRQSVPSDEPFAWWGPFRRPTAARSILDLIRDGVLDAPLAGLLWAALVRRSPLTVVAGPSGAGKTTLLTALLDFLPAGERRVYVRGCYEPFAFLDDPAVVPRRTTLLILANRPHPAGTDKTLHPQVIQSLKPDFRSLPSQVGRASDRCVRER